MEHRSGEVVVVTGMTGAGRSTAAKELEDLGYYVVDNLPPTLLREVVRLVDESRGVEQPIAVVVDGGPPQVAAAQQAMAELGVNDIPVCGLAKRLEEVWLPGEEDPVIMARTSEGLYLLQRIRDEAHRFAINHHRNRRSKSMVESMLDDVPGLGEVRRKTLLKHFGSLKKLREADVDQIALVPGIGPRTATAIKDAVAKADATRKTADKAPVVNTATGEIMED